MLRIIGARVEEFVDTALNEDYENELFVNSRTRLFIVGKNEYNRTTKYQITLWSSDGMCGSGYTTATWGNMDIDIVEEFGPINYIPIDSGELDGHFEMNDHVWQYVPTEDIRNEIERQFDPDSIKTEYFSYSYDGGDGYYPRGHAGINWDKFKELKRNITRRPVWIFRGASGLGKSTLGHYLAISNGKTVFETDSVPVLPNEITADVVIMGNKSDGFSKEEIISKLFGEVQVIFVDFSKEDK